MAYMNEIGQMILIIRSPLGSYGVHYMSGSKYKVVAHLLTYSFVRITDRLSKY